MTFKCQNCWIFYKSSYKKSKFCSTECKKDYYNDYNEDLSLEQKKRVLKKRSNYCHDCGFDKVPSILEVHHIIPTYKGGLDTYDNLVLLCPNCHAIRHLEIRRLENYVKSNNDS